MIAPYADGHATVAIRASNSDFATRAAPGLNKMPTGGKGALTPTHRSHQAFSSVGEIGLSFHVAALQRRCAMRVAEPPL